MVYGKGQDGTLKQLGSISVPKGRLPSVANQTAGNQFVSQSQESLIDFRTVTRGTLRLALQSDQRFQIKVSYNVSLNILSVSDDGTIVASTPITDSPKSQLSQTNPKMLAAHGDGLFELHFTERNVAYLTSARSFYFDAGKFTTGTLSRWHRQLTAGWETVVQNVPKVDGIERFLMPKRIPELVEAAHSGPVVVLNVSEHRCDALILKPNFDNVMHIPLPTFSFERAQALQRRLSGMLKRSDVGVRQDDERGMRFAQDLNSDFPRLLSELWDGVVRPVLVGLDIAVSSS